MAEVTGTTHASLIDRLFDGAMEVRYSKDQLIFHPDDPLGSIYRIKSGLVKIYALNNQGEEYIHVFYGNGEIFPLLWLLDTPRTHHNVFIAATSDATLCRRSFETILQAARDSAELSFALLQQATKQFNIYADRLDNLEYKYASERLAYRLLFLAGRFGEPQGKTIVLPPLTQQDIAATINISRESANRELERLERKGLIGRQGRRIVLHDLDGLRKELHSDVNPFSWQLHV